MENIIKDKNRFFSSEKIPDKYKFSYYMKVNPKIKAVFMPITREEVSDVVKYCYENNITFVPQAAGTGAVGAQFNVLNDSVIIDLSLMNNIIDFDEETLTITVEPGVKLGDVQKFLENKPYFYPPDPGAKDSTIGGNVSTNAGGMRAVKYGTTRDYVKELEVVLPEGEISTFGSLNIKDASGYNLKDLFIGSEGTLGILTNIKLKVIPEPKYSKSLILSFNDLNDATNTVLDILGRGFIPSALEMFDKKTIKYSEIFTEKKFPSQLGESYILTTFDGFDLSTLERTINQIETAYKDKIVEVVVLNDESEKIAWKLRDNILYSLMELTKYEMLDEVVPISKFAEMINFTKDLSKKYNTTILNFGHAGDGNIHTLLLQDDISDEEWFTLRTKILDELYVKVYELGGLISAEHGVGYTKRGYFIKHTNNNNIEVMRKIKKALDPKNLLNPNKVI